jgi:hypothetical protein
MDDPHSSYITKLKKKTVDSIVLLGVEWAKWFQSTVFQSRCSSIEHIGHIRCWLDYSKWIRLDLQQVANQWLSIWQCLLIKRSVLAPTYWKHCWWGSDNFRLVHREHINAIHGPTLRDKKRGNSLGNLSLVFNWPTCPVFLQWVIVRGSYCLFLVCQFPFSFLWIFFNRWPMLPFSQEILSHGLFWLMTIELPHEPHKITKELFL